MEFPEGYYSVKDTMEEMAACPEAIEVVTKAIKLTMGMTIAPGEGMWNMMKGMTMEKLVQMSGSMAPEGFLESINAQLTKIKRS